MNKNTEKDTGKMQLSTVMVSNFKLSKKISRAQVLIIVAIFILLAVTGIITLSIRQNAINRQRVDQNKVLALIKANDCSKGGQDSVSSEKPSTNNINASALLLKYQATCLAQSGQYKQANSLLEQVLSYYQIQNNNEAVNEIEQDISAYNYAAANPIKHVKLTPDITPSEENQLKMSENKR